MKTTGLTLDDKINLKGVLNGLGVYFHHYALTRVEAYRKCDGDLMVFLPGIYSSSVNFNKLGYSI